MALTNSGLEIKRLPDHLSELQASIRAKFGSAIDLSESSVLGVINTIYAAALAEQSELQQAVYNSKVLETAEGKHLDDLVGLIGMYRYGETPSRGYATFKTSQNLSVIPRNTLISTNTGTVFKVTKEVTSNINSTTSATIGVASVVSFANYDITIQGQLFQNFMAFSASSAAMIVSAMVSQIKAKQSGNDYEVVNNGDTFTIRPFNTSDEIVISIDSKLLVAEVEVSAQIQSLDVGQVLGLSGTINNIDTPVTNVISVTNKTDVTLGSLSETDEELRARHSVALQNAKETATVEGIRKALNALPDVTGTIIFENRTQEIDSDGRPPHSIEVIVSGGDDDEIAQELWRVKPAGIETYGNLIKVVLDGNNTEQVVELSRPIPKYINVTITYTTYDEEVFPDNAEELMADAVLEYGDTFRTGLDVIPHRFYGKLFNAVDGLKDLEVLLSYSLTPSGVPEIADAELTIPIALDELAVFLSGNINFTRNDVLDSVIIQVLLAEGLGYYPIAINSELFYLTSPAGGPFPTDIATWITGAINDAKASEDWEAVDNGDDTFTIQSLVSGLDISVIFGAGNNKLAIVEV